MGNPIFRFTLSNDIELPPFGSLWSTVTGNVPWSIDSTPSVILTTTATSSIEANVVLPKGTYTIDYDVTITGSGDSFWNINFFKNGLSVGTDSAGTLSGAGNFTGSFIITITEQCDSMRLDYSNFSINTRTFTINSLTISDRPSKIISEPDGWKNCVLKLDRHKEYDSLIEYFDGSFVFYGSNGVVDGGADYIRNSEREFGFNTNLRILIEASVDEGASYEELYDGLLALKMLKELPDNKIQVPITQNDQWNKFISRVETPVDLRSQTDLYGNAVQPNELFVDLNLTSQELRQEYGGRNKNNIQLGSMLGSVTYYGILDFDIEEISEIYEKFTLPRTFSESLPSELFAMKYGGTYTIDAKICLGYRADDESSIGSTSSLFTVYLQKNSETPIPFTKTNRSVSDGTVTDNRYNGIISMQPNDILRLYVSGNGNNGSFYLWFLGEEGDLSPAGDDIYGESYLRVTADTVFESSSAQTFLIHDAAHAIVERITGNTNFYSEIFGSQTTNARQYNEDGCFWNYVLSKGLHIRGYTLDQKPFFLSFKDWWEGANPIFSLGLGIDIIDDIEVIRVEPKSHFYDSDNTSVYLNNAKFYREYDDDKIFERIEIGYQKWQSENIAGLDDPQTKHTYATILKGKPIRLYSDFIAASLAIEQTRRQTIEFSKDYKFDNDTFITAINEDDVSPDRYRPELDENFDYINNLTNSNTRYNLILTPARNLLRWLNYFSGCLQKYMTTSYQFVSGEGNFDMSSKYDCSGLDCVAKICDEISEKQNISLNTHGRSLGFLHLPDLYTIEQIDMSLEEYLQIRNSRNKCISVSQTTSNHKKFFIKELAYNICQSTASIKMWAASEVVPVEVVPSEQPLIDCGTSNESGGGGVTDDYAIEAELTIGTNTTSEWDISFGVSGGGSEVFTLVSPTLTDSSTLEATSGTMVLFVRKESNGGLTEAAGTVVVKVDGVTVETVPFSDGQDCSAFSPIELTNLTGLTGGEEIRVEITEVV